MRAGSGCYYWARDRDCDYVRDRLRRDWLVAIAQPMESTRRSAWTGVLSSPATKPTKPRRGLADARVNTRGR